MVYHVKQRRVIIAQFCFSTCHEQFACERNTGDKFINKDRTNFSHLYAPNGTLNKQRIVKERYIFSIDRFNFLL